MNRDDKASFVMEHVAGSERYKSQYTDRWLEAIENFTVSSWRGELDTANPYRKPQRLGGAALDAIYLKDPETHKAIMAYVSKLVRTVFGDARSEYVIAEPVGWEDAIGAAPTVSRLLRYAFMLPGHFRTMTEAILDMLLFGTGVVEVGWWFEQRTMPVREMAMTLGVEEPGETTMQPVIVHDDVDIAVIDVQDFFPDPGESRIEKMRGAAKRFRISRRQAQEKARSGLYISAEVERALSSAPSRTGPYPVDRFREGRDQPESSGRLDAFGEVVAYEYWGEVPWQDSDGATWRVLTVMNGSLVRDNPWPYSDYELPFKTLTINPVCGRFYGISPAEVIRFDQDFADALKELIARAIIRQVHPPIIFDPDVDIDPAALRRWKTDMPIPARGGTAGVGTLQYGANVPAAQAVLQATKFAMQEGTGATGAITGEPGPSREAATAATFRVQSAMDRPELAAMLLERESMPSIGRAILRRYQQFLDTTDELARRVGEIPEGVWLGDIMADYDVRFVGSRQAITRQMKLQSYQTLAALATGIPTLQISVPWHEIAKELVGNVLELPEIAAKMPDASVMGANLQIAQLLGRSASQNGVAQGTQPPGLPESQAAGAELGSP